MGVVRRNYKQLVVVVKDTDTGDIVVELPDKLTNEDLKDFNEIMSEIYKFIAQEDWRLNNDH